MPAVSTLSVKSRIAHDLTSKPGSSHAIPSPECSVIIGVIALISRRLMTWTPPAAYAAS